MPISKKDRLYYTREQMEAARRNSNALEYARHQGYDLVRKGSYYHLREHDSMVFTPEGKLKTLDALRPTRRAGSVATTGGTLPLRSLRFWRSSA